MPVGESTAARLARIAERVTYEDLPEDVQRRAAQVIVDTLASSRGGLGDPFCDRYVRTLEASCSGDPAVAAFQSSLPTTVLQYDEGHREARGHPGIHVVPAAVAVAQEAGADGAALMEGVVAGYEVAARIGVSLGGLRGDIHPHGAWGAFGAAIAAGKILGAGVAELEAIIEAVSCVPFAPWRATAVEGATIHYVYAALGAEVGVRVAQAVMAEATVIPGSFEDWYRPLIGANATDIRDDGFEILNGYIKYYPSCAHTHTALDAIEELLAGLDVPAGSIAAIEVRGYAAAARLNDPEPKSNLAARFSLPYLLARRICRGPMDWAVFGDHDLSDAEIQSLASRIVVRLDEELDAGYPAGRPVHVTVRLTNGETREASKRLPRGDGAQHTEKAFGEWRDKLRTLDDRSWVEAAFRLLDTAADKWTAEDVAALARR